MSFAGLSAAELLELLKTAGPTAKQIIIALLYSMGVPV